MFAGPTEQDLVLTGSTDIQLRPAARQSGAAGTPRAGLVWHFAPIDPALRGALLDVDFQSLAGDPRATCIKAAGNRDTWRIAMPAGAVYAKCYRRASAVKRLVHLVHGCPAWREWSALRHAAAIGVPAPEPLGYALAAAGATGPYAAVLVTAALPANAVSVEQAWLAAMHEPDPRESRRAKQRIGQAVAGLLARAHVGGLFHHDLHAGNVLLFQLQQKGSDPLTPIGDLIHSPEPPASAGPVVAALLDLHNARLCRGIRPAGVRRNLLQLHQWLARHATRTERLRLLRTYCRQVRGLLAPDHPDLAALTDAKALARRVLARADAYARRLHRQRDRRIGRDGKYFGLLRLDDGWRAQVVPEAKHGRPYAHLLDALPDKGAWRGLLAQLQALTDARAHRVLKRSASRDVLLVDLPWGERAWPVVLKHERAASPLRRLAAWLRGDPLWREFAAGWRLLHRDLPVALPLAALRRRGQSLLLVEYVPDSHDLDTFSTLHLPEMDPARARAVKRRVGTLLAGTIRRLWACRLVHRDLKAANVRLQLPGGDWERASIVLVDVDGIRRPRLRPQRALLRSLARLNASFAAATAVTRTDRLRVLQAVLRDLRPTRPDWKSAWRRVAEMSLRDQATIAKQWPRPQSAVWMASVP